MGGKLAASTANECQCAVVKCSRITVGISAFLREMPDSPPAFLTSFLVDGDSVAC